MNNTKIMSVVFCLLHFRRNFRIRHANSLGRNDNCNIIYLFTEILLLPGGSVYFTCKQNMKLVTTKFNVDNKNQLDVTFCIIYFSSNSCSTCFGQPCAHHQELTTA